MRNIVASLAIWALLLLSVCMAAQVPLRDAYRPAVIPATDAVATEKIHKAFARDVFGAVGTTVGPDTQRHTDIIITSYSTTTIYLPTTGTWLKSSGTPRPLPSSIAPIPQASSPLTPSQSSSRVTATGSSSTASHTVIPFDNAAAISNGIVSTGYVATAILIAVIMAQMGFTL